MGSLWGLYGVSVGLSMRSYGSLWVSMGLSVGSYGSLWISMGLYGICGPLWVPMRLWCLWVPMGSPWGSFGLCGSLCGSLCVSPWLSVPLRRCGAPHKCRPAPQDSKSSLTPLHIAVRGGNLSLAQLLLRHPGGGARLVNMQVPMGRLWGGCGAAVGRLWGGCGAAVGSGGGLWGSAGWFGHQGGLWGFHLWGVCGAGAVG